MFPIFDDAARFAEHGKRRIKRLPERAQAIIEKLQPFYQAAVHSTDPHKYSLWALEALDTGDKHRLLTLTVALPLGGALRHQAVGGRWTFQPFRAFPFKDGAEIAHVRLNPFRPEMDANLNIVINVAFDAALGTGDRQFVVEGLETILKDTTLVVDVLEAEFFR